MKVGDIVRIRRTNWSNTSDKLGVLVRRTYLAYEQKYSKWCVMTDGKSRVIHQSNLFAVSD